MRLRNTLVLFSASILLGAYIYFFEINKNLGENGKRLLDFSEDDIEAIVLNYQDQKFGLNRLLSGKWVLTHPLQYPADESVIRQVLSALYASKVKRVLEENPSKKDLATFGLDKPYIKLLVTGKKGKALPAILVGDKTPVGRSAYVKRENDPAVLLTSTLLRSSLEKTLYDFRDKGILQVDPEKVAKLTIRNGKELLVLVRGEGEDWRIEAPQKGKAKPGAVSAYLSTLTRLRAQGFVDHESGDLKKYGLKPPSLKILFEGKLAETIGNLLIGENASGEYYAKWAENPILYTIDKLSYTQVHKTAADFSVGEKSDPNPTGPSKE
ncbi:MAG: DUF4340 domain-containing protein [Candidatus Binatia bacterium]